MNSGCVKPFDENFCIIIPMWKQNGGYQEGISRIIHVKDEGMGGYLLSLIHEQQKIALLYQEYVPEKKKNALFTYRQHKDQFATKFTESQYISMFHTILKRIVVLTTSAMNKAILTMLLHINFVITVSRTGFVPVSLWLR